MGRLLAWACLMSATLLLGLREKVEGTTCSSEVRARTRWNTVDADLLWSQLGGGLPAFTALRRIQFGEFNAGMVVYWLYTAPPMAPGGGRPDPSRITLNFRNASSILLHVNTRHDQRLLVLNSRLNGQWQQPIPLRDRTFPTVPGQNTTITILAAEEEFELYARQAGEPLYQTTYSYTRDSGIYIPVETVTRIDTPQRTRNPTVYLMAGRVLCDYSVGRVVYIHGTAPESGDFSILMVPEGPPNIQLIDISLTIRPNLDKRSAKFVTFDSARCSGCSCLDGGTMSSGSGSGSEIIYPNSTCDATCDPWWGRENIDDEFPFRNATNFVVIITAQQESFEIAVNGEHYNTYWYRIPILRTMTVLIAGVPYIDKIEYY